MKRSINILGIDKEMIHLDQLKDGTWRLIYHSNLIPDITKVSGFEIVRED